MDKQFFAPITKIVEKTLVEKGFGFKQDGDLEYYSDDSRAFMIAYNDEAKTIELKFAILKEGEGVDFKTVSSWMLDESATENDFSSIGNDFSDTVLEQLGVKATAQGINKVELPSKEKHAETVTIDIFTARFLAIFTSYKEAYMKNVSDYGEFMYDKFFTEYGVEVVKNVVSEGNKKQVSKLFELLNSCYILGDSAVTTTITFCILGPALVDDEKLRRDAYTYMEKYPFLYQAAFNMVKLLSKPSKKAKYIVK